MINGALVVGISVFAYFMIAAMLEARSARTEVGRLRLMLVRYGEELVHGEAGYRRAPDGRIGVEAEARRLYDQNSALAPAPHSDEDFPDLRSRQFDAPYTERERRWLAEYCDAHIVVLESGGRQVRVPSRRRTQGGGSR